MAARGSLVVAARTARREAAHPADGWSASPYVPTLLLHTMRRAPGRAPTIEPVAGTLLFADISGFTALSERLAALGKEGAERLTAIINTNFARLLGAAHAHGGDNLKFGGDALALLFTGEGHAHRAVTAALEMQEAIRTYGAIRSVRPPVRLRMSVGVHSGRFWSATAGVPDRRMQHFILGADTARLAETEGAASAGQVLITEQTRRLVEGLVRSRPEGEFYLATRSVQAPAPPLQAGDDSAPVDAAELHAYLPPPVAAALDAGAGRAALEGEHRKVSVIFVSLRGVNELVDSEGADALLADLQRYVEAVVRLADQHGGFLVSNDIDSHGLKLILAFGAPVAHETDAANALRLALALNAELDDLGVRLHHRIGVNSGFVFAGDVGSSLRRDYTVMGDAVNLAARLMSAAESGQILVSRSILEEAGRGFVAPALAPIRVKGKSEPIPIHDLQAESAAGPTAAPGVEGELFGRDAELETLRRLVSETESAGARTLVLTGEPGTGKSRLLAELERLQRARGWRVLRGPCYAHTVATPFAPWIPLLHAFFETDRSQPVHVRTAKVRDAVLRLRPDLGDYAPLLNPLLSLSLPDTEVLATLDDDGRRRRMYELITGLFAADAAAAPLALIVEDLHWADSSSLRLLGHLRDHFGDARVMVCSTQRPTETPIVEPRESSTQIELSELPHAAALTFVRTVLDRPDLPAAVSDALWARCRGNPLFLEEVGRTLRESDALDALVQAPAMALEEAMAALELPDRVQSLMMSRIDRLPPLDKHVLRLASVLGASFAVPTLHALFDEDAGPGGLEPSLEALVGAEFLVPEADATQRRFRFRHVLIRDVAYDSLLRARRRELHGRVGAYLEDAYRDGLEAWYEALAHHYGESGDATKTVLYTVRAGDKARRVFAVDEALEYYRRGLDALQALKTRVGRERSFIRERMGDCYEVSGRHREAARTFTSALRGWRAATRGNGSKGAPPIDLSDELPGRVREAALCRKIAVSHEHAADPDASLRWLTSAEQALPPRQPLMAAQIQGSISAALFRKGSYQQALERGRRALAAARRSRDPRQLAYAHLVLGNAYDELGQLKRGIRHRTEVLRLYEEVRDLVGVMLAHQNLGLSYQALGQLGLALEHCEAHLEGATRIGNTRAIAIAHNNIGELLMDRGRLADAIDHLTKTVDAYRQSGEGMDVAGLALVNLSQAEQMRGDLALACERLGEGMELLRRGGAGGLLTVALVRQAELELAEGAADVAARTCGRVLRDARAIGMQLVEARALRVQGRVFRALGRDRDARRVLRDSVRLARTISAKYEEGLSLLELAELARSAGGGAKGHKSALERATRIFEEAGAAPALTRAHALRSSG